MVRAAWPKPTAPIDASLSSAGVYLFKASHTLSASIVNHEKKVAKAKGKGAKGVDAAAAPPKPNQVNRS